MTADWLGGLGIAREEADSATIWPPGQPSNRRPRVARTPLDGQQRLMLLRFDAGGARRPLAEIQEAPDFMSEIRQRPVINFSFHAPPRASLLLYRNTI